MSYKGETRLYELENGCVYKMPSVHCVFCKHCTDLFYDYTNGPYGFTCEKELELNIAEDACSCESFEDDGYIFDEEDYKKRRDEQARIQGMMLILRAMKDKDIEKQLDIFKDSFIETVLGQPDSKKE